MEGPVGGGLQFIGDRPTSEKVTVNGIVCCKPKTLPNIDHRNILFERGSGCFTYFGI